MTECTFLFLSPHLDDVALSCAGAMFRLVNSGQKVTAVTVFTADVNETHPLSWLAQRNQRAWGLPKHPFAIRCEEDQRAMQLIGAAAQYLGLLDVIYRLGKDGRPLYQKTVLGIPIHEDDLQIHFPVLVEKFRQLNKNFEPDNLIIFCPLGVGGHVDHALVRQAAEEVWLPENLIYYEDFPYAGRPGVMQTWLGENNQIWSTHLLKLSEQEIKVRIASVSCYTSQIRGLFPSTPERMMEIVQARIGFMKSLQIPPNLLSTLRRTEDFIHNYIHQAGGERYWLRGEKNAGFLNELSFP